MSKENLERRERTEMYCARCRGVMNMAKAVNRGSNDAKEYYHQACPKVKKSA